MSHRYLLDLSTTRLESIAAASIVAFMVSEHENLDFLLLSLVEASPEDLETKERALMIVDDCSNGNQFHRRTFGALSTT